MAARERYRHAAHASEDPVIYDLTPSDTYASGDAVSYEVTSSDYASEESVSHELTSDRSAQ